MCAHCTYSRPEAAIPSDGWIVRDALYNRVRQGNVPTPQSRTSSSRCHLRRPSSPQNNCPKNPPEHPIFIQYMDCLHHQVDYLPTVTSIPLFQRQSPANNPRSSIQHPAFLGCKSHRIHIASTSNPHRITPTSTLVAISVTNLGLLGLAGFLVAAVRCRPVLDTAGPAITHSPYRIR